MRMAIESVDQNDAGKSFSSVIGSSRLELQASSAGWLRLTRPVDLGSERLRIAHTCCLLELGSRSTPLFNPNDGCVKVCSKARGSSP